MAMMPRILRDWQQGKIAVAPSFSRNFYRAAVIGLAVATVALAGCGRRGPLEPPGLASVGPTNAVVTTTTPTKPATPPAKPDRKFVLDPLL